MGRTNSSRNEYPKKRRKIILISVTFILLSIVIINLGFFFMKNSQNYMRNRRDGNQSTERQKETNQDERQREENMKRDSKMNQSKMSAQAMAVINMSKLRNLNYIIGQNSSANLNNNIVGQNSSVNLKNNDLTKDVLMKDKNIRGQMSKLKCALSVNLEKDVISFKDNFVKMGKDTLLRNNILFLNKGNNVSNDISSKIVDNENFKGINARIVNILKDVKKNKILAKNISNAKSTNNLAKPINTANAKLAKSISKTNEISKSANEKTNYTANAELAKSLSQTININKLADEKINYTANAKLAKSLSQTIDINKSANDKINYTSNAKLAKSLSQTININKLADEKINYTANAKLAKSLSQTIDINKSANDKTNYTANAKLAKVSVNAKGYVLMEKYSKKVLAGEDINKKLPMASTTKIVTAICALMSGKTKEYVTITKEMVGVEGSSIYLQEGEKILLEDLVYGLMLRSGNDCAVAIAIYLEGSVENFAVKMNKYAENCGAVNTNFVNPHGLHNDNHYTTAYDLGLITCEAMQNQDFKKIVSAKTHRVIDSENPKLFVNKNKILSIYEGGSGVKTGFTKVAGRCLVSASDKNGMEVVTVVLGCPDMWQDSINLMNYAHTNYVNLKIVEGNKNLGRVKIEDKNYSVCVKEDFFYPYEKDKIIPPVFEFELAKVEMSDSLGAILGKLNVYIKNDLLFSTNLYKIE